MLSASQFYSLSIKIIRNYFLFVDTVDVQFGSGVSSKLLELNGNFTFEIKLLTSTHENIPNFRLLVEFIKLPLRF